jgi:glycosyltransferase 2 family protein
MKKIIIFSISTLVGIALFVGVIFKVGPASIWRALDYFSIGKWFIIISLYTFQFFLTQYRWRLILKTQGYNVPISKLSSSKLVGFTVDYLSPTPNVGGEAIRAYVLKRDAGVPFSQGLASIIIDKVMDFSYALPFVIFGIFYSLMAFSLSWKVRIGLLGICAIFLFLLGMFFYRTFRNKDFFGGILRFFRLHKFSFIAKAMDKIAQFEQNIINFFHNHRKVFYQGLLMSFIGGASVIFALWLILFFLQIHTSLFNVVIISVLTVLTFVVPIPGSFGTTETGVVLIFVAMGFKAEEGVAYTLIFRSVDLLKIAFGLLFLSHLGLKISQTIIKGQGIKENGEGHSVISDSK